MIDLSSFKPQLKGRPLAVLGLGKSGLSVFEACRAAGIETVLWDDAPSPRTEAEKAGARLEDLTQADFKSFAALCLAPGIPLTHPKPHPVAARARAAGTEILGDIEIFHRARGNVRTIGITGTNGKSTTTALCGHILKHAQIPSACGGNLGEAVLTLPDLPAASVYVLELSSYQIDLCPTFAPDIAALVNLGPDHLERHGGMEGYVAAKEKIFRGTGTAVIGMDDSWSQDVCARVKRAGGRKIIPVSCLRSGEGGINITGDGILFDGKSKIIDLKTCPNLRGRHNWQNAGIAWAACRAAGAGVMEAARGLQSFPGLAHRQNIVATLGGVLYVNDSKATNDQAAAVALAAFDRVYWIAGGQSKNTGYKDCTAQLSRVRHAFLIGEAEKEMADWLRAEKIPHLRAGTLDRAVAAAHAMAQAEGAGGAVLLSPACASFDQFSNFEHRGQVFTQLARALAKKGAAA